jgi:4-amino-4-deoxy-L-arabinose transferase-like glycosyltransferase
MASNAAPFASSALPLSAMPPASWLWLASLGSLVVRLMLAAGLPLTGDEALFYWWSRSLDYGYYDHPPMAAWWIAGSRWLLGEAEWAVRMPAVLLPLAVGGLMWWAWAPVDRVRAAWAVLLFWLTPFNWLVSLMATDTPLIFWAVASVACLVRAEQCAVQGASSAPWYALSGVCIGAAFLSKYFAVLLGVAYLVYFAVHARSRWWGLVCLVLCAMPAAALNVWWNLHHCWTNIMFNLVNRNQGSDWGWDGPAAFLGMMLYLLGPGLLWWFWRGRAGVNGLTALWRAQPLMVCVAVVPLLCFAWVSLRKDIGLHWVMAFYPFLFLLAAWCGDPERQRRLAGVMVAFLAVHLVAVLALVLTPLSTWEHSRVYPRVVNALEAPAVVRAFDAPGVVMGASSYASGSVYGYALGRHVPVIGPGSKYARQDDLNVDYAAMHGRTIRIVQAREPDLADYAPYFRTVRALSVEVRGVRFYAVEGEGFDYPAYRATVQVPINARYYAFPSWLPVLDCPFCQRFCGQAQCTGFEP